MEYSKSFRFLAILISLAAIPARLVVQGSPDTAGSQLQKVWKRARVSHPDALLILIKAETDAEGSVVCDSAAPFEDGWRFTFYSSKKEEFIMMAECQGQIGGPLVQFLDLKNPGRLSIQGRYMNSDRALRVLAAAGISMDARKHNGGGKRPFAMELRRWDDPRSPQLPILWKIQIGEDIYFLDAVTAKSFTLLK